MTIHRIIFVAISVLLIPVQAIASTSQQSLERMNLDAGSGKALVAHVVVALCDNESQGIVPVSASLGDGDSPRTNLYWGAKYGVKRYFSDHKDWIEIKSLKPDDPHILERAIFKRGLQRGDLQVSAYVVADAWRGSNISKAIGNFVEMSAGLNEELVLVDSTDKSGLIAAGGSSHLVAYVGHNGLMEFTAPAVPNISENFQAKSSIVLACYSDSLFSGILTKTKTHSLLTTNGLMAPEAYTLEAAISSWFSDASPDQVHLAAASAYSKYQKAKLSWTTKLFSTKD